MLRATSKVSSITLRSSIHVKANGTKASINLGYEYNSKNNFLNVFSRPAFSTLTSVSESNETAVKCPFSQGRGELSNNAALSLDNGSTAVGQSKSSMNKKKNVIMKRATPTLQVLPSWPIVGSFFSIIPGIGKYVEKHYNIPSMITGSNSNIYEYYSAMNEKYGDFYAETVPGLGVMYTLTDPNEMLKVLRQEGAYPRGGIAALRPFIRWAKDRGQKLVQGEDNGFFGQGETWRTLRTFMQTDLLSPQAAKGYVPAIVESAKIASKGAKHYSGDLNNYLHYCAFDMFQTVMLGEFTKVSDPDTPTDPTNIKFVENSVISLGLMVGLTFDGKEVIKGMMGITTPKYKEFETAMDNVYEVANEKIIAFHERWERGELNEAEKASYIARAFERQKEENSSISSEEMTEILMLALNAGVDTTSTFIAWAIVHLSLNPDVQERLYKELKHNLDANGGSLSSEMLTKKKSPYLHNFLRESHRLTPVHPMVMMKSNSTKEIKIHGVTLPKGSLFSFNSHTLGVDPNIIDNSEEFIPDRWTPEATLARKDTQAEVLDHQFYKDPFSQGARRCPGSRVAINETLVLLSQLILDWKIRPAGAEITSLKDIKYEKKTLLVPILPKMDITARM